MKFIIKPFAELSLQELYESLHLRNEVFVVEQDCVYQDVDNKDSKALHLLGYKGNELLAYCRIFKAGDYFAEASIGRVVVKQSERKYGYGHLLMKEAIKAVQDHFQTHRIKISAQQYLKSFYETHGFQQSGEPYLEDGIPHIAMFIKE